MSKWEKVRLGNIGEFKTGGTPSRTKAEYFMGNIPWITTKSLRKMYINKTDAVEFITPEAISKSSTKLISKHSVMIGTRVGVGKVSINIEPMCTNQDIISIENINDLLINKEYLVYFIRSLKNYFGTQMRGATIQGISSEVLKSLHIPLPPLETQKQIAKTLDTAAELLAMRKQQLAELDNLIKSTFYETFGDPVVNEKGWEMVYFTDVLVLQRGFDLPVQSRVSSGNVPVFGSNGVLDYHNEPKVKNGGVITGRSGTIGKVYYTLEDYWPLNTTLFSVDLKGNNIIYLAYLLQYFNLNRFSSGTGVPTLNRNIVHSEKLYRIPLSLQEQFATIVTKIEEQKAIVKKAIDETQYLFDSLMSQYFE